MNINLSGRTAFVTGGNLGLGRGMSLALAECGADVALTYYSHKEEGEETVRMIEDMGCRAYLFQLDATNSSQVDQVVGQVAEQFGGHIDILMNNAGHLIARKEIAEMSDEHWHKVMNVNVSTTFYCTRSVLPHMNTGWGRIVNMSSLAARNGGSYGQVAYSASKGAIISFTRALAKEVASKGITVNAVAPGVILETPFHETFTADDVLKTIINNTPLKRGGVPEDVAGAVIYFVSELGSFVTGEVLEINGGLYFA